MKMHQDHTDVMNVMHNLALKHLNRALFTEGDDIDAHLAAAHSNLEAYLIVHRDKFPRTESDWEANPKFKRAIINAILTDTMGRTQDEITGSDDSWGDYLPDGLTQAQALTDDGYDGNGFTWYVLHSYIVESDDDANEYLELDDDRSEYIMDKWGCTMQDATSDILTTIAKVLIRFP